MKNKIEGMKKKKKINRSSLVCPVDELLTFFLLFFGDGDWVRQVKEPNESFLIDAHTA